MAGQHYAVDQTKGIVIAVAGDRRKRPHHFATEKKGKEKNAKEKNGKDKQQICPFCPGCERETPVANIEKPKGKWRVRAFENKYPFFTPRVEFNPTVDKSPGFGKHEVIVETPNHGEQFEQFSKDQLRLVFEAYVNRFTAISNIPKIAFTYLFRNHGREGGATIAHEHAQLIGLPFIPEIPRREMEQFEQHRRETGKCFYCEMAVKKENKIFENRDFVCVRPAFARFALECWIIPKKHLADFTALDTKQAENMMLALKEITRRLKKSTENYNVAFHCSAKKRKIHFHIEVYPKTDVLAGIELGTGLIGNPRSVKDALKALKG